MENVFDKFLDLLWKNIHSDGHSLLRNDFDRLVDDATQELMAGLDDVEKSWYGYWMPIVCNDDGTLDPAAVKRELHYYLMVQDELRKKDGLG